MIIGSSSANPFKNNQTCKSQNKSNRISAEITLKYFLKTFPDFFIGLWVKTVKCFVKNCIVDVFLLLFFFSSSNAQDSVAITVTEKCLIDSLLENGRKRVVQAASRLQYDLGSHGETLNPIIPS